MHLYFHLERSDERIGDEHGIDVEDLDAARRLAVAAAADIAADDLKRGSNYVGQRIVVTSESGDELIAVVIEARMTVER